MSKYMFFTVSSINVTHLQSVVHCLVKNKAMENKYKRRVMSLRTTRTGVYEQT